MALTVAQIKRKAIPILRKHKVKKAGIFGSAARGEMKRGSDVDILVELGAHFNLFDFVGLKLELQKALKTRVDLVEYGMVKPRIRDRVLSEEVSVL